MTLLGIDIASHQSVEVAGMDGIDFVIVKATQGTWYTNPDGDKQYQTAKAKGRLLGSYHYAEGGDPVAEANFFVDSIQGYIKEATLWLDWEQGENKAWGNTNWCRAFVNHVYARTGVWCGIYVQASALNQVANLASDCPLWIAGYPTNDPGWTVPTFMYSTAPWPVYTIWQFTSGGKLDKNIANLTAADWKRIADPKGNPGTVTTTTKAPAAAPRSLDSLANEVNLGTYGDGDERKQKLGSMYNGVQAVVNHRAGYTSQAIEDLANETIAGVYGDGERRKQILGGFYGPVQERINAKFNAPQVRTYTVKSGDTLSGIAAKLGIGTNELINKNGISNPDLIFAGQVLQY
ncbi:MAG: GH25 family lysozyme [Anaerorhabdus sp.]|uniref:GH25 family lysozyme n=1 Tax=Anaerorhabdus sp. TaxID=1872524 RepID=UPI002FC5DEF9